MKGHPLHCGRAHLKVPGWYLVWNAPLTKKWPMFLSRLSELHGGCEKILPVSGSFWCNLKFFLEWWILLHGEVGVNEILSLFSFCDVCTERWDDSWSICWARWWPAWTTEAESPHLSKESHVFSDFSLKSILSFEIIIIYFLVLQRFFAYLRKVY